MKGSVRRRGTGWEYRFDLPPDPLTGRRREVSKMGFATRKEAEASLRKALSAVDQGKHVPPSRRTLGDFLTEWLPAIEGRVRSSTWSNYRDYRDAYVMPTLGGTQLQNVSTRQLNLFYTHLLTNGRVRKVPGLTPGLAPKTVRNVHVMLHRALRDACRWGYIGYNPAENAEPPALQKKKPKVWTPQQLRIFIEYARDDRFYALWLLIATTGLRRGELAGLRIEDVDLKARRITPEVPRVVVDGFAQASEPKTAAGYRRVALDPIT